MDTRHLVKVGDYFNIIQTNTDDADNHRNFDTCLLVAVGDDGRWHYKNLFHEYSDGDYPFFSGTRMWDVFSNYAKDNFIIRRIESPETEGFKDKKVYLQKLMEKRVEKLKEDYDRILYGVIVNFVLNHKLSEDNYEKINLLPQISENLKKHGHDDFLYDYVGFIDATRNNWKFPYLSFVYNDNDFDLHMGEIVLIDVLHKTVIIKVNNVGYPVSMENLRPNKEVYPIDFGFRFPFGGVFGTNESESLAKRIMCLTKSWDEPMTWEQYYETMSGADKAVSSAVKRDFDRVIPYLQSPETCAMFSPAWNKLFYEIY